MVKVQLNIQGLRELRKEPGVKAELARQGQQIAAKANAMLGEEGYVADQPADGKTRAHVNVKCDTPHAYYSNLQHNTLLKAIK